MLTVARTDPRVYDFPAWLRFQCAVKTGSEGALGILKLENGLLNLALAHLVFKKGTVLNWASRQAGKYSALEGRKQTEQWFGNH